MDADEEARSRQYKGTAMSDDIKFQLLAFMTKATEMKKSSLVMM